MGTLFSDGRANAGRQLEMDMARGLAVLFMIFVHTQEYFSTGAAYDTVLGGAMAFFGGLPAAPAFMFLLGASVHYSGKASPQALVQRGLGLLAAGYALNLARAFLPFGLLWLIERQDWQSAAALESLAYVDILQFAGLAFVVLGLVRLSGRPLLLAALGIPAAWALQAALAGVQYDGGIAAALSGLLWGSSELSFFPLLSWLAYPLAGFMYGHFLIRCADKPRFSLYALAVSLAVLAGAWLVLRVWLGRELGMEGAAAYYHHGWDAGIVYLSFTVAWLNLLYALSPLARGAIRRTVERWSHNVTVLYLVHWLVIGTVALVLPLGGLGAGWTALLALGVTAASDFVAWIYGRRDKGVLHSPA